jgi:hypothetical protein
LSKRRGKRLVKPSFFIIFGSLVRSDILISSFLTPLRQGKIIIQILHYARIFWPHLTVLFTTPGKVLSSESPFYYQFQQKFGISHNRDHKTTPLLTLLQLNFFSILLKFFQISFKHKPHFGEVYFEIINCQKKKIELNNQNVHKTEKRNILFISQPNISNKLSKKS